MYPCPALPHCGGGGAGGITGTSGTETNGATGTQGLIIITYTAATASGSNLLTLGVGAMAANDNYSPMKRASGE